MEVDFIQLVLANAPNYLGFMLLYFQQSRMINRLMDWFEKPDSDT